MTDTLTAEIMQSLIDKYTHDLPPKFIFLPADEALKLSEWMNTVLGLLEDALDFAHSPGCSGDIVVTNGEGGYRYPYPCECGKASFDEKVRAILSK